MANRLLNQEKTDSEIARNKMSFLNESLNEWKVLSKLNDNFKISMKILCVFGYNYNTDTNTGDQYYVYSYYGGGTEEYGKEVIFVTNDDLVYVFGDNNDGVLGINSNNERIESPVKVDILSNKGISKIAYGLRHVIALTESGDVYSWGNNERGQIGNGLQKCQSVSPYIISFKSNNRRIVDVCCGRYHSLMLTDFGQVYSWGYNWDGECGNGNRDEQLTPYKINGFNNKKVIAISCGGAHSMALTESGEVFSWGYNGDGQLGIGNNDNQNKPIRVINLYSVNITKIAAGDRHSLLLSSNGEIYTFGRNHYGQLGIGNEEHQNEPVKMSNSVKFKDIFSTNLCFHTSAAISVGNQFYIWGEKYSKIPTATNFKSINEIYASFSPQITWKSEINFENN